MQFSLIAIAAVAAGVASALPAELRKRATVGSQAIKWDSVYDNAAQSMDTVSCSNGLYGLDHKYPTFGSVPQFGVNPNGWNVAASPDVAGWGSPNCGLCYTITFQDKTVNIIAVDAGLTFNVGHAALDYLTGGRATELGTVRATVAAAKCP